VLAGTITFTSVPFTVKEWGCEPVFEIVSVAPEAVDVHTGLYEKSLISMVDAFVGS